MSNPGQEFLKLEYESTMKVYEVQFTHFMGVFYFWIVVMTFPATAGLISSQTILPLKQLGLLLGYLALIGLFLSAKMFDIRCSQLSFTHYLNNVRSFLYEDAKTDIPSGFSIKFGKDTNLRHIALTDFGMWMALVMSVVNGTYATLSALYFFELTIIASVLVGVFAFSVGVLTYIIFLNKKVPGPEIGEKIKTEEIITGGA